jgi:hypothetical protein
MIQLAAWRDLAGQILGKSDERIRNWLEVGWEAEVNIDYAIGRIWERLGH